MQTGRQRRRGRKSECTQREREMQRETEHERAKCLYYRKRSFVSCVEVSPVNKRADQPNSWAEEIEQDF